MTLCPICKSRDAYQWGTKNNYILLKCRECTHLFADLSSKLNQPLDNLDESGFRSFMTHDILKDDTEYYKHLLRGEAKGDHIDITFNTINALLGSRKFDDKKKNWLDVGSGSGYIVEQMAKKGWEAKGIEPGEWGQIAAREKKIDITKGFLSQQTFPAKFNIVSATDVLEHQPEPIEFIELLRFYLKPQGYLIISIPFADSLFGRILKSKWAMIEPPTHCQFFNRKSISTLANRCKLSIEEIAQYNSTRFRFVGRFKWFNRLMDSVFKLTNWGDQAVIIFKPLAVRSPD